MHEDQKQTPDVSSLTASLALFKNYPHICNILKKFWHDDEILALWMNYLLQDTRENTRQGFPQETVQGMILLYNTRRKHLEHYTNMGFVSDVLGVKSK